MPSHMYIKSENGNVQSYNIHCNKNKIDDVCIVKKLNQNLSNLKNCASQTLTDLKI